MSNRLDTWFRVTSLAGNEVYFPVSSVGGVSVNGSVASVYSNFAVPTQGANALPVEFDIAGDDVANLLRLIGPTRLTVAQSA